MTAQDPREYAEYKTDHDLLIELRVVSSEIRRDIRELKDGTHQKLDDHEARLRVLEGESDKWIGKQSMLGAVVGILAGLIGSFIQSGKLP
jgi:tetrahydromethanopterin S-methyltransferase subunit G